MVREFHLLEPALLEDGAGPVTPVTPTTVAPTSAAWFGAEAVWELLLDRMTMPLGSVQVWD